MAELIYEFHGTQMADLRAKIAALEQVVALAQVAADANEAALAKSVAREAALVEALERFLNISATGNEDDFFEVDTRILDVSPAAQVLLEKAEQVDELNQLFNVQHEREMEAIQRWREEAPGRDLQMPDYGRLLDWLLARGDRAIEILREYYNAEPQVPEKDEGSSSWRSMDKRT